MHFRRGHKTHKSDPRCQSHPDAAPSVAGTQDQDFRDDTERAWSEIVRHVMVAYQALFDPDPEAGGFVVTFPDFHYGVTQGDTLKEAVGMAEDLLAGLISDLVSRNEGLPKPGRRRGRHYRGISLPALQSAKVELYQAFRNSGIRKSEL